MLRAVSLVLLGLVFSVTVYAAEDPPRAMTSVDMVELPRLSEPALSPDGSKLLYLRSHVNWKENKTIRRYRLIDLRSGDDIPLFEPEDEEESFGRGYWAPDGSGFITVLDRGADAGEAEEEDKEDNSKDDTKQAYFYSIETGELRRLTEHGADVRDIIWAPDGKSFYFRPSRLRAPEEQRLLDDDWLIHPYDTPSFREVWRYTLETRTSERIIGGDFSVSSYSLSDNGSKIIHMRAPGALLDDSHDGDLWSLDIRTGETTQLTQNHYRESSPKLSPKGNRFAYIATVNEDGEPYYEDNLFVQNVGEQAPRLLLPHEAMEVVDFAWAKDGEGVYILGNIGLRTELFFYSFADDDLTRLTTGDHVLDDWSYLPAINAHIAIIASASNPGEIYLKNGDGEEFKAATTEYQRWNAQFRLPTQEAVSWRGRRGATIEGLLVYPLDYEPGERFPLVTITHGGPRSSSQFGSWNYSRYLPVLAAQGYGVLLPNHRGGTGYGDRFMRDMVGGYFTNAHHDVLDGIDALVARGLADPDRLIKMGWSAGGHMTNKIITVTDRFKAASSGAGASDWISMYGESDVRHNRTPWFGGAPWEKKAPLRSYTKQSMLKDSWKVKTPTLFLVGADDERVPPTQSIMMYRGVRAGGAKTMLYQAPGQPHGWRRPSYRLFKINTELSWFAEHALNETYEPHLPNEASPKEDDVNELQPVGMSVDTSVGEN